MSVILECQPGDEFVCIQGFHASPDGESFSWNTSRHFRIGERLRYLGAKQDPRLADRPNEWMVLFETSDGKRYAATQTYFVTEECWKRIKKNLARRLLREKDTCSQETKGRFPMAKKRSTPFPPIIDAAIKKPGNKKTTEDRQIRDANALLEAWLSSFPTEADAKAAAAQLLAQQGFDATNHDCSGAISHLYPEAKRRQALR